MISYAAMKEIVSAVSYKPGWTLHIGRDITSNSRPYLQVCVSEAAEASLSPFDGTRTAWRGGKRYLSARMCRQEIVGACFGAIRDAEEHEMKEWFRYRRRSIYNPHLDPDALAEVAVRKNMNLRDNAMSMTETDGR